jgi:large subunit ribosomal protein L21
MWAIVDVNSKQYKVKEGDSIEVDSLKSKVSEGKSFPIEKVLLFCNNGEVRIGQPYLEDVKIDAEVTQHFRGDKIVVFTYKRRKGYKKKHGHRQMLSRLKILKIVSA